MGWLAFMARRFVAGERRENGIEAVRALNAQGLGASLDFLGENVSSAEEAQRSVEEYRALLEDIAEAGVRSNVSLKLTQLGLDIGHDFCVDNVGQVLEQARKFGNTVRIDMESSAYTDATLRVFSELRQSFSNVGIVIQAYLHRSEEDAQRLIAMKAPVRVCKGAYKEPPSLAFQDMDEIRVNFRRLCQMFLRGGCEVGIATHDESLVRWALDWTAQEKINRKNYEFQMLYGLRRKRGREIAGQGYAMRSYVPYGSHWFPYFFRRLRERKENVFFVLKGLWKD